MSSVAVNLSFAVITTLYCPTDLHFRLHAAGASGGRQLIFFDVSLIPRPHGGETPPKAMQVRGRAEQPVDVCC